MENRGGVVSYPYLLLICLLMMISLGLVMYLLGTKISYTYILYNASISIGSGVIFFLVKIILTMDHAGPIEQILDAGIALLLITVWIVALIETFTVELVENGQEIKGNLISIANWIKTVEIKAIPSTIVKKANNYSLKAKSYLVRNKLAIKILKIISEIHKNRVLNKRV